MIDFLVLDLFVVDVFARQNYVVASNKIGKNEDSTEFVYHFSVIKVLEV